MKLSSIYDLFIKEGIKVDPRKKEQVRKKIGEERKSYRRLDARNKRFFDKDNLWNPYSDTRILYGKRSSDIKRILIGIDIGVGELLLSEKLSEHGKKIDLIIAHHPIGVALAGLYEVMDLQTDLLSQLGIDQKIAESLMDARTKIVERGVHGANHTRTVDAAKLLDIPLMCCHTPADNHVATYLQRLVNSKKPKNLKSLINLLMREPEYKDAALQKAGPKILVGKPENKTGKTIVDMTGGTEGSQDIFARISQLGVKTLIGMHLSEAHYNKVKGEHINVVIAGHMASDNLGMNLLLDKLEKKGNIEIIECSGFRRFKR